MNSSEQKQVYLLGRMLFRDPKRAKALIDNDSLKVPEEAAEFTQAVIKLGRKNVKPEDVQDIYQQPFCIQHFES